MLQARNEIFFSILNIENSIKTKVYEQFRMVNAFI